MLYLLLRWVIVVRVITDGLEFRYDRRVSADFLRLFTGQGAFRTLTEYARKARYPIDLQFRGSPKSSDQHASLYVGLTTVLDVHWRPGQVRLAAHPKYRDFGFDPHWMSWTPAGLAADWSDAVDRYLDAIIPYVSTGRAAVEGSVQAAVSSFSSNKRAMLDREVMLHFRDTATRNRIMDQVSADLLHCLGTAPVPGTRPRSFGGKCDLLALDSSGSLLAVEVKPRGVSTIVWAPAQAIVYARLLRLWTRQDPQASEVIAGMISQRKKLGLLTGRIPRPSAQPAVLPVVAVQRGMSGKHREGMLAVRDHLTREGIGEAARLQMFEVTLAGRLLDASGPAATS